MTNEPPPAEDPRGSTDRPGGEPDLPAEARAAAAATETPAPGTPSGPRRLYRSRSDDWFGGVAGGLAEYFDTDPTLIRIVFVIAAILTSGFAIIAYVVAWIVIPEEPAGAPGEVQAPSRHRRRGTGAIVWGGILIVLGTLFLLAQLDLEIDFPSWRVGLALALIFVGLLMVYEARSGFHGGLVTLAVILSAVLGLSAAGNVDFGADAAFSDQRYNVTRAADLEDGYSMAFGSLTVDLDGLDLPSGTTELKIDVVFGDATLVLPDGIPYRVEATSVFGSIDASEFNTDGIVADRTYASPDYDEAERKLDIEMSVVFGSGRIR